MQHRGREPIACAHGIGDPDFVARRLDVFAAPPDGAAAPSKRHRDSVPSEPRGARGAEIFNAGFWKSDVCGDGRHLRFVQLDDIRRRQQISNYFRRRAARPQIDIVESGGVRQGRGKLVQLPSGLLAVSEQRPMIEPLRRPCLDLRTIPRGEAQRVIGGGPLNPKRGLTVGLEYHPRHPGGHRVHGLYEVRIEAHCLDRRERETAQRVIPYAADQEDLAPQPRGMRREIQRCSAEPLRIGKQIPEDFSDRNNAATVCHAAPGQTKRGIAQD